jgi:hypothetical protein
LADPGTTTFAVRSWGFRIQDAVVVKIAVAGSQPGEEPDLGASPHLESSTSRSSKPTFFLDDRDSLCYGPGE